MTNHPLLIPLTQEAREALSGRESIDIDCAPFRIGRESRLAVVSGELYYMERRKGNKPPTNDLYLIDSGELLNISREHLLIDADDDGAARVFDRGSACGTIVDGHAIGGRDRTGSAAIAEGSEIIIGLRDSPFRFTVKHLARLRETRDAGPER